MEGFKEQGKKLQDVNQIEKKESVKDLSRSANVLEADKTVNKSRKSTGKPDNKTEIKSAKTINQGKKTGKAFKNNVEKNVPEIKKVQKKTVGDTIAEKNTQLRDEVSAAFAGYKDKKAIPEITNFQNVSRSERNKRIKEATKREEYAEAIEQYEKEHENDKLDPEIYDKKELVSKISGFMESYTEEFEMDTDEKFMSNLDKNYYFCKYAQGIKILVSRALDEGYLPDNIDMEALQTRIAGFEELKQYLDNRCKLMKSPYYKYFTSGDVAFTDAQIEQILNTSKNEELKAYLQTVKDIRTQGFARKKGIQSVSQRALERGKTEAKLLSERIGKREAISELRSKALDFKENAFSRDKDYDSGYDKDVFLFKLNEFKALNLKDIHFASIHDIAEHFESNVRIFGQAREIESLMVTAVRTGSVEISDKDIMELRAKVRVISEVEKIAYAIQKECTTQSGDELEKKTNKDILNDALSYIKSTGGLTQDGISMPEPGNSLTGYYSTVLKAYKKEQEESRENIRKMYGLMHPDVMESDLTVIDKKKNKSGDKAEEEPDEAAIEEYEEKADKETVKSAIPGSITDAELNKRVKNYQKNALFIDHMRNSYAYNQVVWTSQLHSFSAEYERHNGINFNKLILKLSRTMTAHITGMSSKDLTKIADLLAKGTGEEKDRFYKSFIEEAESLDPVSLEMTGDISTIANIGYKIRMSGIYGNIQQLEPFLADEEDKKKAEALYNIGCAHYTKPVNIASRLWASKWARAVDFGDFFKYVDGTGEMKEQITETDSDYMHNGDTYINGMDRRGIGSIVDIPVFMNAALLADQFRGKSSYTPQAADTKYFEMKNVGLWKETKAEDIDDIKDFYKEDAEKRVNNARLVNKAEKLKASRPAENSDRDTFLKYSNEVEGVFRELLEADLDLFSFKSYSDITKDVDRFNKCRDLISLAGSTDALISWYRNALEFVKLKHNRDKNVFRLTTGHLAEIQARCDLLKSAAGFFDGSFLELCNSTVLKDYESIDELLHQPDQLYLDRIEKAQEKAGIINEGDEVRQRERVVLNEMEAVMEFRKNLNGFDINMPLKAMEKRMRQKRGIISDLQSTPQEVLNLIKGRKSVLENVKIGDIKYALTGKHEYARIMGKKFSERKMTVSEREKLLSKEGSEQYNKKQNLDRINSGRRDYVNQMYSFKRDIPMEYRISLGEETIEALLPFMKYGEAEGNKQLIEKYSDEKTRDQVLDALTARIMEFEGDLELSSDEDFARRIPKLESMTRMVYSYRKIMEANPEYKEKLKNVRAGGETNDLDAVNERVNKMLALSDYYRARKLLLSDPYYMLHGNSELSTNADSAGNEEQVRISSLLNLVHKCAVRIRNSAYDARDMDDTEQTLKELETGSAREAYLTGRPDVSRMDPARLKKTHMNIKHFMQEANIRSTNAGELLKYTDPKAYPNLQKYLTEDVKNYLKIAVYEQIRGGKIEGDYLDYIGNKNQKLIYKQIDDIISYTDLKTGEKEYYQSFELKNPKTKEVLNFPSLPARLITDLVYSFGAESSGEELKDIIEGLLVGQKGGLNLEDEKDWAYARERWISSVRKLYELEYNSVARFERTYGSLPGSVPTGCFMQSLGGGTLDFATRMRFGQNFIELSGLKKIVTSDGEKISVGELLSRQGMISSSDNKRENDLADVLQNQNVHISAYYSQIHRIFGSEQMMYDPDYSLRYSNVNNWAFSKNKLNMSGPGLSKSGMRKLWKNAVSTGDPNVMGGNLMKRFHMDYLNLYTTSERKELKKQRTADQQKVHFAETYLDDRAEELTDETVKAIGADKLTEKDKKLIRTTLINFHPALYDSGERTVTDKDGNQVTEIIKIDGIDEYHQNIKKFLGIDIEGTEKEKLRAKKEAFVYLLGLTSIDYDGGSPDTPDDIMSRNGIRDDDENVIYATNNLLKMISAHRMYGAMQDLAKDKNTSGWMDKEVYQRYRERLKANLKTEVVYSIMHSTMYMQLKDLGNPEQTAFEKEYEILKNVGQTQCEQTYLDLDKDILTEEVKKILKDYKIRIDDPIGGLPEAEPVEKKKANISPKPQLKYKDIRIEDDEIKEEKKAEVKEEKKSEEKKEEAEQFEHPGMIMAPHKGVHTPYENQGEHTHYCWACAMNGLMNAYAGKKISDLNMIKNQPLKVPGSMQEAGLSSEKQYLEGLQKVDSMYAGREFGSPLKFGDYILSKLPGTMVKSAQIGINPDQREFCKQSFLEILRERLKEGPVAMLHAGHYVLVEGLEGENLIVRDSQQEDADNLMTYFADATEIFNAQADNMVIELVWLEKLEGNEVQTANEFGLKYDQSTGQFTAVDENGAPKEIIKDEESILQKHGIEVVETFNENSPVLYSVYLPKIAGQPIVLDGQADNPVEINQEKAAEEVKENQKAEEKKEEQKIGEQKAEVIEEEKKKTLKKTGEQKVKVGGDEWTIVDGDEADLEKKIRDRFKSVNRKKSSYYGSTTKKAGFYAKLTKVLEAYKHDTEDESYQFFSGVMVKNSEDVSPVLKSEKARQLERFFEIVLEFDMKKLNFNSLDDIFNGKLDESMDLIGAISGLKNDIKAYEKMIGDENVQTAMSWDQFTEVRARCDFISSGLDWLERLKEDEGDIMKIAGKHKLNLKGLMKKTDMTLFEMARERRDASYKGKTDDEMEEISTVYYRLGSIKLALNSIQMDGIGQDFSKAYKNYRKDIYSIKNDSFKTDALNAIRKRQKDEATLGSRLIKRYAKEFGKHSTYRHNTGSDVERRCRAEARALKTIKGDDEEQSYAFYCGAMINTQVATPELKSEKTRQLERVFEIMLEFDLNSMNFRSLDEIINGKNEILMDFGPMVWDLNKDFFNDYEKLIDDENAVTSVTKDQFREIRARWEFFHTGTGWVRALIELGPKVKKYKLDLNDLLKKSEADLAKISMDNDDPVYKGLNEEERRELGNVYIQLCSVLAGWRIAGYKGIGDDFTKLYEDFRKKNYGIENNTLASDALKAIHGRQAKEE